MFGEYCGVRRVDHPAVGAYLDHLWSFIGLGGAAGAFKDWCDREPPLVAAGLGYGWPEGFADHLADRGVSESEFRQVLCATTEILYGSLFGATEDRESRRFLGEVTTLVGLYGVRFPDLAPFTTSCWSEGNGWGYPIGPVELAAWRG